jgi:hypothetical protein
VFPVTAVALVILLQAVPDPPRTPLGARAVAPATSSAGTETVEPRNRIGLSVRASNRVGQHWERLACWVRSRQSCWQAWACWRPTCSCHWACVTWARQRLPSRSTQESGGVSRLDRVLCTVHMLGRRRSFFARAVFVPRLSLVQPR